jgi:peptide/nickel transport system ATP-binding protein
VRPPIIALDQVTRRYAAPLDLAARAAKLLGAGAREIAFNAVDQATFAVDEGEVVGLVGESGGGKSSLGRIVAGIDRASAGRVSFRGAAIDGLDPPARRKIALKIQMIFQDPFASLNPRMRVAELVGEAPAVHAVVPRADLADYVDEMLRRVGLDPALKSRYPHQFSGGQRARIGIARALAVQPDFLVCDEPVAALDVSIQAQVLNLFMRLREDLRLSYLFISHDLGVVRHLCDRVVIMYLGRVVEIAPTDDLFRTPHHPYTQALLANMPRLATEKQRFAPVAGEVPSPLAPPTGCHFHPRCPFAMRRCREERPMLKEIGAGRLSACHLH